MRSVDGQRAKLVRLLHRLEGGVLVETTSSHALTIPAGCAHATFTLQGGYLITTDFTTVKSLISIATYISNDLDEALPPEAREISFEWFQRCLDFTLAQQHTTRAVCAWLKAEPKLAFWASTHRSWRVSVRRLWEQYCQDIHADCPCGFHESNLSFLEHFSFGHMGEFLPLSQRRRWK